MDTARVKASAVTLLSEPNPTSLPYPRPSSDAIAADRLKIAILAGNSRLATAADGSIYVEPQLRAFEAALRCARDTYADTGVLPPISIAFDHKGVFRQHFLVRGLTNSQKRNPRLSQLRPEVLNVFAPILELYGIIAENIFIIHEDSARTHIAHILQTTEISAAIRRRMLADAGEDEKTNASCALTATHGPKLTCAAITREYFVKATRDSGTSNVLLEVFFEKAPWSQALAYVRGLQMTHLLGARNAIRLNSIDEDGTMYSSSIINNPHQ
jgi:hypothetical protein